MRKSVAITVMGIWLAAAAVPAAQVPSQSQQPPSPKAKPSPPVQAPNTPSEVKVQTRLITIDVVVTDSHGSPIRGLKQEDFSVLDEHGGPQKIVRFEFMDGSANRPAPAANKAETASGREPVFSNRAASQMRLPPTVLLMDALNTQITNQVEVHKHMLSLLKTLPADTPIAIFTLGHNLHVVQNFTTDPGLLKTAVDHALRSEPIEQNPLDDPNSASNVMLDQNGGTETSVTQALEDFEKLEYEGQMTIRVDETTAAMVGIAKYLGGYPGRKNLVWFSESFPIWIEPTVEGGGNPALGITPSQNKIPGQEFAWSPNYTDKVRQAAEALTDAQVSVYPVDAKGLDVSDLYSVSQTPHINHANPGAGFASQLTRENSARSDAQATMKEIAESTGGRICTNTNDLGGCVQSALNDGETYYELAYYPEGVPWDGRFHKVTVKTTQRGARLAYRRGYFATDAGASGDNRKPEELLKQACIDPLPSTSIALSVEPVASQRTSPTMEVQYLLTVSPSELTLTPENDPRKLSLEMAICEYDPKGDQFQFFPRDLSRPVPDALLQSWQEHGIRSVFDYGAKPEDKRLRFAVLDVPSGTVGSVDVPAHPAEFGSIPPGVVSAQPLAGTAPAPQRLVTTSLIFKSSSGKSSVLDWKTGEVSYQGDLGIDVGAAAFFQKLLGGGYHCDSGNLVSNDPKSSTPPRLAFLLQTATGSSVLVDMTRSEPEYSGNLPVSADGKAFFAEVWKLCHCKQP